MVPQSVAQVSRFYQQAPKTILCPHFVLLIQIKSTNDNSMSQLSIRGMLSSDELSPKLIQAERGHVLPHCFEVDSDC